MRLTRIFVIFVFLVLGLVPDALGGVNLKNGNFYISYTDVEFDSKFQIQRTYNSKSTEIGFFGFGWGSDFETFLVVLPDRSVMVFENGAGSKTRFESPKPDPQAYEAGIQKVIEIAKMLKEVESEQSVKNLEAKIRSGGVEALIRHWLKYKKSGLVESPVIPVGTVLQSGARGDQTIRRVADGFLRVDYEGTREYFNRDGLLVRQVLKNDDEFTLTYDGSNVLKTITDGRGRTAKFKFNNVGQVENIEAVEGTTPSKRAVYSYSSEQQLIASTDAGGNNYKHEYDAASNMTRVRYTDGTSMDIAYHPGTMFTRSIKDRNGEKTLYDYAGDSSGDQYSTTVKKLTSTGEVMSTNSYEYFIKADEFGNRWTQRIIITIDGRKTDTEYDKNNRPVVIRRNGGETKFAYDAKGRLVRKETSTEIVDMTYHERLPHFTRVENTDKKTGTKTWTAYRYDIAGNLTFAESSDGRSITLDYDALGQISAMTRKDGSKLKFKYNSLKKPIEILLVENGVSNTLNITYDKKGEIEKIDSSGGQDMALKITSAFQELLAR